MPTAMRRTCLVPGCPNAQAKGGYCAPHAAQREAQRAEERGTAAERGYGYRWSKLRLMVLRAQPACVVCGAPATDVDHIIPKRLGGTDARDNLQSLCHACHTRKTMRERTTHGGSHD